MAKLIIQRTSEWNNRMRDIGIYLDGEKIGTIGNGQTREFEIEPGEHQVRTKVDWCGSKTVNFIVADTEIQKVELSGFKFGKWLMPVVLIFSVIYFAFGERIGFDPVTFLVLILPVGGYLFYHLTIGRNNYLRLKKM